MTCSNGPHRRPGLERRASDGGPEGGDADDDDAQQEGEDDDFHNLSHAQSLVGEAVLCAECISLQGVMHRRQLGLSRFHNALVIHTLQAFGQEFDIASDPAPTVPSEMHHILSFDLSNCTPRQFWSRFLSNDSDFFVEFYRHRGDKHVKMSKWQQHVALGPVRELQFVTSLKVTIVTLLNPRSPGLYALWNVHIVCRSSLAAGCADAVGPPSDAVPPVAAIQGVCKRPPSV